MNLFVVIYLCIADVCVDTEVIVCVDFLRLCAMCADAGIVLCVVCVKAKTDECIVFVCVDAEAIVCISCMCICRGHYVCGCWRFTLYLSRGRFV